MTCIHCFFLFLTMLWSDQGKDNKNKERKKIMGGWEGCLSFFKYWELFIESFTHLLNISSHQFIFLLYRNYTILRRQLYVLFMLFILVFPALSTVYKIWSAWCIAVEWIVVWLGTNENIMINCACHIHNIALKNI